MRSLTLALLVMGAACTTEAPEDSLSQHAIKPHDGPVPGTEFCGSPGNCTVGSEGSFDICRSICDDPGMPFTSGCWDVGGPPQMEIGQCFWTPH